MEKLEWNLDELFKNDEEFYCEIENVKDLIKEITSYQKKEINAYVLEELLNKKWYIKELSNNILVYGSLRYYKNVNDENCLKLKTTAETFNNEVNKALNFIDLLITSLGKEQITNFLKLNSNLKIYELSLDKLFRKENHLTTEESSHKLAKNNNEINSLINTYLNIIKDMKYDNIIVDEKEVQLTNLNLNKYLAARDRETRRQTYESLNNTYFTHINTFAEILIQIYSLRNSNATMENYQSVLEQVLFEENIKKEVIDSLVKAVNNNLNLYHKYLELKAQSNGIMKPHLYDYTIPLDSNLKITYTLEEAKEIIFKALEPLGSKYLDTVKILFNGHIDAYPNASKHQSITFSWHTYSFLNFKGSYNDLKNLIHEIGHIVNYYLSKENVPFIYEDSTVFVGETSSIVNEILLNKYLLEHAESVEEKIFYLSKEVENYIISVFNQTMYTELELSLYNLSKNNNLDSEIISNEYFKVKRKYYGDNTIYDDLSIYEWAGLGKLYRWSYYHYKYATGLLMASVIASKILDKTLDIEKYLELLSSGSKMYSLDLLKIVDVDLENNAIIDNGFKILKEDISKLEILLANKDYLKK